MSDNVKIWRTRIFSVNAHLNSSFGGVIATIPLLLLTLPIFLFSDTIMEDALITARYARNLAAGNGLVYNIGEHVLGTTTPLWAIFISWIFLLPISSSEQALIVQFCGFVFVFASVCILIRSSAIDNFVGKVCFVMAILLVPSLSDASRMGMETGLLIFESVLLWYLLYFGSKDAKGDLLRGIVCILLLATRLDSLLFIFSLYLSHVIIGGNKRELIHDCVILLIALSVFCIVWMTATLYYYGQVIPQSMLAKTRLSYTESASTFSLNGWLIAISQLLYLDFPWPRFTKFIMPSLLIGMILMTLTAMAWRLGYHSVPKRSLLLSSIIFVAIYSLFFAIGQAGIFPWYAHLPTFILFSGIYISLAEHKYLSRNSIGRPSLSVVFRKLSLSNVSGILLLVISVFFLSMHLLVFRGLWSGYSSSQSALRTVGEQLKSAGADSVMLEPIGYIGFYSSTPKIYDLAGLVSPEVFAFRKTSRDGWFSEALQHFKPEYVVLRSGEVEMNIGWNVGKLFATDTQREWWTANYKLVNKVGGGPGYLNELSIYKREDKRSR